MNDAIIDSQLKILFEFICKNSIRKLTNYLTAHKQLLNVIEINENITSHIKYYTDWLGIDEDELKQIKTQKLTALTFASCFGFVEIVKLLVEEFKVDITEIGFEGANCFLAAVRGDKPETMQFLHSVNKELCLKTNDHGDTALMIACYAADIEIVKLLINEFNADATETGDDGRTCFIMALQRDDNANIDIMRFLHEVDDNLCKMPELNGYTPLALA